MKRKLARCVLLLFMVSIFVSGCGTAKGDAGSEDDRKTEFYDSSLDDIQSEHYEGNIIESGEDSGDSDDAETDDAHSIWIDGYEIKILKYLDNESMVIKLALGNTIIQGIAPRILEDEEFVAIYSQDTWNETTEIVLRFVHVERTSAVMFSYISSPEAAEMYNKTINDLEENDRQFSFKTLDNRDGFIQEVTFDDIVIDVYDDASSLPGYIASICDTDNQWIVSMALLSENEVQCDFYKEHLKKMLFKKQQDEDFEYLADSIPQDYEERMQKMYEKYKQTVKGPTSYLCDNYDAPGTEYRAHYLYDLTNDGIPEMIFLGNPGWICVVGEENAVHISADEIAFSGQGGDIYTCYGDFWEESWDKYCIACDEEGYLSLICSEQDYLKCKTDYSSGEGVSEYLYQGVAISEEAYFNARFALYKNTIFNPKMYDGYEYIASQKGFYRSAMILSDELLNGNSIVLDKNETSSDDNQYDETTENNFEDDGTVLAKFIRCLCDKIESLYADVPIRWEKFSVSSEKLGYKEENDTIHGFVEIEFEYPYFKREVLFLVSYILESNTWERLSIYSDEILLNGNVVNGVWSTYIEATHPMHIDSIMKAEITVADDPSACEYDFLWTSRFEGGYDQHFSGSGRVDVVYNEDGFLEKVILGYDSGNGRLVITNEGVIFEPMLSNDIYVLKKSE